MGSQKMCACTDLTDSYRYDPPPGGYVHKGCGKPRDGDGGPTNESVLAFIDRVLARRAQRESARLAD